MIWIGFKKFKIPSEDMDGPKNRIVLSQYFAFCNIFYILLKEKYLLHTLLPFMHVTVLSFCQCKRKTFYFHTVTKVRTCIKYLREKISCERPPTSLTKLPQANSRSARVNSSSPPLQSPKTLTSPCHHAFKIHFVRLYFPVLFNAGFLCSLPCRSYLSIKILSMTNVVLR